MGKVLDWLIRGGEQQRRSRLRDYENRLISPLAAADMPLVLWQSLQRRVAGRRPMLPWFPYPALRRLRQIIRPSWQVLEFGSGNSTLWLARRVRRVRSVESDSVWADHVRKALLSLAATVDYCFVDVHRAPEQYWSIGLAEERTYDLVIVDGLFREQCITSALRAVRSGGYIYLDNIDSEARSAYLILRNAIGRPNAIEVFTGFPPAQPTVTTGALAHALS